MRVGDEPHRPVAQAGHGLRCLCSEVLERSEHDAWSFLVDLVVVVFEGLVFELHPFEGARSEVIACIEHVTHAGMPTPRTLAHVEPRR